MEGHGLCIAIEQGVVLCVGLTLFALTNKVTKIPPPSRLVAILRGIPKVPIRAVVSLVVDLADH